MHTTRRNRCSFNYQAFYSSSSPTGSFRDSRGYQILREQAYVAQRKATLKTRKSTVLEEHEEKISKGNERPS